MPPIEQKSPVETKRDSPVSVRFSPRIHKRLTNFSRTIKKSKSLLIQEAVDSYIDLQEWQIKGVEKAIQSLEEGKGVSGEIAMEWFHSLGTNTELPMPISR